MGKRVIFLVLGVVLSFGCEAMAQQSSQPAPAKKNPAFQWGVSIRPLENPGIVKHADDLGVDWCRMGIWWVKVEPQLSHPPITVSQVTPAMIQAYTRHFTKDFLTTVRSPTNRRPGGGGSSIL